MDKQASSPVILVTDDDRSMRSLLRFALEEEGYQVILADHGEQCLNEIARSLPDMILINAVIPGIDGFECCRRSRILLGEQNIPILMVTVLDDKDSVDKAFRAGATVYITKPIHWGVLRQRARRLIAANFTLHEARQVEAWESLFRALWQYAIQLQNKKLCANVSVVMPVQLIWVMQSGIDNEGIDADLARAYDSKDYLGE